MAKTQFFGGPWDEQWHDIHGYAEWNVPVPPEPMRITREVAPVEMPSFPPIVRYRAIEIGRRREIVMVSEDFIREATRGAE